MFNDEKKNYAFISYSHQDVKMAKWLQRKLESFKLPTEIHNEFEDSKYLRPVIRDRTDFDSGVLKDELSEHLSQSKYLIVICSPHSAKSDWVSREVQAFINWGRIENIIPFIITDETYSGSGINSLPKSLIDHVEKFPDDELLGINIAEAGREKAYIRVVSRMLGINFDELWKRHERERRRRLCLWSITILCASVLFYLFAMPISLTVNIRDAIHRLPMPEKALLTVNGADYPLSGLDTIITIPDIPGYLRGQLLDVEFSADYYDSLSLQPRIALGMNQNFVISLKRDSTFAVFAGSVVDDNDAPIKDAEVRIDDQRTTTDADGRFRIVFPVVVQSEIKPIKITKKGMISIYREDECPSENLQYIMHQR